MNYSFDSTLTSSSKFIQEDYFPIIIEFSNEELNNLFLEFNYKDSDMFELSVDAQTFDLKRFTLTLCNHYVLKEDYVLTIPKYQEGLLHITGPTSTECTHFEVIVYRDGVEIKTSSIDASHYLKYGQLIFALTESDDIASILITDLTEDNINHVITELTI